MTIIDEMRSAGFDDDTIGSWANDQKPAMKQAGFDDATIDGYFSGLKQPGTIPRPFLKRASAWLNSSSISDAVTEGAKAGFGEEPLGPTPEDTAKLRDLGVYDNGTGNAALRGLRMANEMVVPAAVTAADGMFRGFNGILSGIGAGAGQLAYDTGLSDLISDGKNNDGGEKSRRDMAHMVTIGAMLAGTVSPVTRAPKVPGAADDVIGHLPAAQDYTAAAKIVANEGRTGIRITPVAEAAGVAPTEAAPETIQSSYVRIGDKYYTGVNHIAALEDAARETGKSVDELASLHDRKPGDTGFAAPEDGFVTSTGRYVDRQEAKEIANAADQTKPEYRAGFSKLNAQDLKAPDHVPAHVRQKIVSLYEDHGIHPAEIAADVKHDPEIARALLSDDPKELPKAYVEAYHGSPHDFEKFDSSKIGTGEGAQSFGHGLYFAENPDVAGEYSRQVTAAQVAKFHDDLIKNGRADRPQPPAEGNLYQVRITADQGKMLDWDKPLSEQSPAVLAALKKLGYDETVAVNGEDVYRQLSTEKTKYGAPDEKGVRRNLGGQEASKALADAGIHGIKYLDEGSRDITAMLKAHQENMAVAKSPEVKAIIQGHIDELKSQGTRNLVVFNDKHVEITHKNGEAVAAAFKAGEAITSGTKPIPEYSPGKVTPPPGQLQPAGHFMFPAESLNVDAKRFQFKSDGDAQGVNKALSGVTQWDTSKSGGVIVWQQKDGQLFVADGHQRSGLARRLMAQGHAPIDIPGVLYREVDGVSSGDAMEIAASANIANGSGSALDGAKVLRNNPALINGSIPLSTGKGKQAVALSRLSDEAFGLVVNEVVPENYGAIVGEMIPKDGARQVAALKAIARFDPRNVDEAAALVNRVKAAELAKADQGAQGSMFGDLETAESTAGEEMKIVGRAIADLKKDKTLFGRVVANAERIEQTGSKIEQENAKSVATDAEKFARILASDAYSAGPIRTVLVAAAKDLKNGHASIGDSAARVVAALRGETENVVANRDGAGGKPKPTASGEGGGDGKPAEPAEPAPGTYHKPIEEAGVTRQTVKYTDWKDVGGGYSIRESTTHPEQQIKTAEGNILIRGLDTNGKEYQEYEMGHNPLGKGGMGWVDKAVAELQARAGRPKLDGEILAPSARPSAALDAKILQLMTGRLRPEYIDTPEFRKLSEEHDALAMLAVSSKFGRGGYTREHKIRMAEIKKEMNDLLDQEYGTLEENYNGEAPKTITIGTEPGADGKPQGLIPGVEPVKPLTVKEQILAAAEKPMTGGDKPADGLFGNSMNEPELFDAKPRDIFSDAAARAEGQDILDGEEGGRPKGLGADAVNPYEETPRNLLPAGTLVSALRDIAGKVTDIWHDIQMNTVPMALGTNATRAVAKDFASALRRIVYEWSKNDDMLVKNFSREDRARMWSASDEESVALQLGESREHQGLVTLNDRMRAVVEALQTRAQAVWVQARDLGMVQGEGLPSYTPRMLINIATGEGQGARALNAIGTNLKTTSNRLKRRAHMMDYETERAGKDRFGEQVELARDIRALPLATADLERAVAGRQMIENIKEIGKRAGTETVSEGAKPGQGWFTIDHPAFKTWRPKLEKISVTDLLGEHEKFQAVKDAEGNTIFEQTPIFVHGDFEGPLRAVLGQKSGKFYSGAMELKGKTMSVIMTSPLIHNAVEYGRAFPTMPGKMLTFRVYRDGGRALADIKTMREAIDHGMVPIGHRAFNQDITSMMEAPELKAGRSITSNVLAYVPGLFDPAAGLAVKEAIDKAGNFYHNTMLWDQVAKLQAGLYVNLRDKMMSKGIDAETAQYLAGHMANRYAGALPREAMSHNATVIANSLLFSRSFTMGNLGVMKDMLSGAPRDVMAQIERDAGSVDPKAVDYARNLARRKAIAVVVNDMVLFYVANSLLQSAINVISGRKDATEEAQGYADRMRKLMDRVGEDPRTVLHPLAMAESLTPMSENEPGKQDRIFAGYTKDGTAIYLRNPIGKIGEEFMSWFNSPLEMLRKKEGTVFRPLFQTLANDKGFGRHVYNPYAEDYTDLIKNAAAIAWHIAKAQTPEGQIGAAYDLATGQGDARLNAAQAFGPLLGITASKGAPGGPAQGELYAQQAQQRFRVNAKLPEWRQQIQSGQAMGVIAEMTQMGVPKGLQQFYLRTSLNPAARMTARAMKDFYLSANPEQRARMEDTLKRMHEAQQ